jgi:cytochrome P450
MSTPGRNPDELVMAIMASPEGRRDPYPLYRELRETHPVAQSQMGPVWYLSRFDDCREVLRDNRFGKSTPELEAKMLAGAASRTNRERPIGASMIGLNPPEHTRQRTLVAREFTPRRVDDLRQRVGAMIDELFEEIAAAGDVDLMDVFAFRLPVRVIGELVGVPEADRDRFRPLVLDAARSVEPGVTDADLDIADVAVAEMAEYFEGLIAKRASEPADDLLSALIAVRDSDGDRLTHDELMATIVLLFAAGFETTTNLIGNGVASLLSNPGELERLRDNPDLVGGAVNEVLRYESPVQLDLRMALEPADVAGQEIAVGESVVTLLGAANRDPAHLDDPDRFDVGRGEEPIMSFASGIHYCLGAHLARMEGEEVFTKMLRRFDTIELLDAELDWRDRFTLRGLETLNLRFA